MTESRAATRVFAVPELLEKILLETPMKEVLLAQRVSREFRDNIKGSVALQRRLFLLPCDKTPEEVQYGDGAKDVYLPQEEGGPVDEDIEDVLTFVYNPFFKSGRIACDEASEDTFAPQLNLLHRDELGTYFFEDHFCATCWCERVHSIPVPEDEKGLAFPGNPEVFAPPIASHSWRQMVYSQPATRPILAEMHCRLVLVCRQIFKAGTTMGEIVDWMEEQHAEHQKNGARVDSY